jgi:hypothetical protein
LTLDASQRCDHWNLPCKVKVKSRSMLWVSFCGHKLWQEVAMLSCPP